MWRPTRQATRAGSSDRASANTSSGPWHRDGQAIVEFAVASILFFLILFGTIDFGRSIYLYAELNNAVREGARYATVNLKDLNDDSGAKTKQRVIDKAPGLGLETSDVNVICDQGPPCKSGDPVTVKVSIGFKAITQDFLGIRPFTMKASATDTIE